MNVSFESDPTRRFSNRVQDYVRYRPGYPQELLAILRSEGGLRPTSAVADIGSGTGILCELLLRNGNQVYGVEPNEAMRSAAERQLAGYANFHSVCGTAESTTLPAGSIDLITAAQAFHWFDAARARPEFARILKPGGFVAIIWNDRRMEGTPFLCAYEQLIRDHAIDYGRVRRENVTPEMLEAFFAPAGFRLRVLENAQEFDLPGIQGRASSSSYLPAVGQPGHQEMLDELARIFQTHQVEGRVRMEYDTRVYLGRLD